MMNDDDNDNDELMNWMISVIYSYTSYLHYNPIQCSFGILIHRASDEHQSTASLSGNNSTGMTLKNHKNEFIAEQSRIQDNIFENIQNHCDELLDELRQEESLNPNTAMNHCHDCMETLIVYLKETFETLSFLPRAIAEVCQYTTCRHISQFIQEVLREGDVGMSID